MARRRCFFLLVAAGFFAGVGFAAFSQTISIDSPVDYARVDTTVDVYVTWTLHTRCSVKNATITQLWVDGVLRTCSGGCSGASGTFTLTPGDFQGQCMHTIQVFAWARCDSFCNPAYICQFWSSVCTIYDASAPENQCEDPHCASSSMGGPVDVASGKMWYSQEDLRIDGPLPLVFERTFVHQSAATNGPLGYGWTHNYNISLSGTGGTIAAFRDAEGWRTNFPKRGDGSFDDNRRHHLTLAQVAGVWQVTTLDQTKYKFNASGQLTSIVDRVGNTVTLGYDVSNRLSTITDPFGRAFTLGYDGSNRINSLADGVRTVTYSYDASGNLQTVVDATVKTWTYGSDGSHRLTSVTDPLSHLVEGFTYDGSNRVQTFQRDSGNEAITFTYVSATQTTATNSLGNVTTFTLDQYMGVATAISGPGCSSCGAGTNESYVLDNYFNKARITDGDGNITNQTFDYWGKVLTKTEASGTGLQRVTNYTYDSTYHFVHTITVPSVDTSGHNRVQTYTYEASTGNLLNYNLAGYSNASAFSYTTTYTYDTHGQIHTVDGPRTDVSDVTTYTRYGDSDSDLAKRGRVNNVTDALSHMITINGYTLSGRPTVMLDQNSVERDDTYDALDRLTETTFKAAGPSGEDLTTNYTPNNVGLPILVTFPNGNTLGYGYDTVNRLTSITDSPGNKTIYMYDTEGRKTREELQDPSTTVTKFTNFAYDSYNRLQYVYYNSIVPPGGGSIFWAYTYDNAGNQTSIKDPLGHLTCFEYDALNRGTKTHQYLGTPPAACLGTCTLPACTDLLTQYAYDTQDHITGVTDPDTLVTTHKVDDAGKVIQQVSPDTGTTTYSYDPAGNLSTKTNANIITETRAYDAVNRLTGLSYPDTSNNVGYTYDSTGVTYGTGRRTGMTDPAGASVFCYDAMGHLSEETRTPSAQASYFTQYAYDKNGNLVGLAYPSGRQTTFTVNASDQVTGASALVNGTSTTVASSIAYEPFGPHTGITFGNGLVDGRSFDSRYRLGTWTVGTLINKTYGWQDDDNITGITDNLNSTNNRAFGYDAIYRLTSPATGPWGTGSYSYDANGNRQTKAEGASSTTYSYYTGTDRLQTATGSEPGSYAYDSNGNTTGDGTHTYQYSQRDRLATVDTGTTATYSYDGDGRRVNKVAGVTTTFYFYDNDGKLIEEYIPATNAGKDYIWLPQTYEPLGRVDFSLADTDNGNVLRGTKSSPSVHLDWSLDSTSGPFVVKRSTSFTFSSPQYLGPAQNAKTLNDPVLGNTANYAYEAFDRTLTDTLYFYHADHLGTPLAITNGAAAFVWQAECFPFGGVYTMPVATVENNLRFPGQYWDSETGLDQNYFRDYSGSLGRFLSVDPGADEDDEVPSYRYVENDPVTKVDPHGLQAEPVPVPEPRPVPIEGPGPCEGVGPEWGPGWTAIITIIGVGIQKLTDIYCTAPRCPRDRFFCRKKCPILTINPEQATGKYTYGFGSGSSPQAACKAAEAVARAATPVGFRTRHCHTVKVWQR